MRRNATIHITDLPGGVDEHDIRNELVIALGLRFAPRQIDVEFTYPDGDPHPFATLMSARYGT